MNELSSYYPLVPETRSLVKEPRKESLLNKIATISKYLFNLIKDKLIAFTCRILSLLNITVISKQPDKRVLSPPPQKKLHPLINPIPKKTALPSLATNQQTSVAVANPQKKIEKLTTPHQMEVDSLETKQDSEEPEVSLELKASHLILLATNVLTSTLRLGTDPVSEWISQCHLHFSEIITFSSLKSLDLSFEKKLLHFAAPAILSFTIQKLLPELHIGALLCKAAHKAHRAFLMGRSTFSEIKNSSFSKESEGMHLLRTINTIFAIKSVFNL